MKKVLRRHGGDGSGNFGHAGRPGKVGGSQPKGEGTGKTKRFTVYHGSTKKFDKFDISKATNYHTQKTGVPLVFFSENDAVASTYGENITKAEIEMKNPLEIDAEGKEWIDIAPEIEEKFTVYTSKPQEEFRKYQNSLISKYGEYDFYDSATDSERKQLDYLSSKYGDYLRSGKPNEYKNPKPEYDGLIIKNVYDHGVYLPSTSESSYTPYTTVYAVTSESQIKIR